MKGFVILILFTCLGALAPSPASAQGSASATAPAFKRSIELFGKKRFSESRAILSMLVKAEPRRAVYWFNLGNSFYMLRKYREAATCFDNVIKLRSPLAPAAQLYRAKALRENGDVAQARSLLENLDARDDLPAGIRKEVQSEQSLIALASADDERKTEALSLYRSGRFDEALAAANQVEGSNEDIEAFRRLVDESKARLRGEGDERRNLWLFGDVSAGYHSNVYFDPDGATPLAAGVMRTAFGVGGRLWRRGPWSVITNYGFDWEETAGAGDLKLVTHQIGLSAARETQTYVMQAGPFMKFDSWGGVAAVQKTGVRTRARRTWSAYEVGSDVELSTMTAQSSARAYLDGSATEARVYFGLVRAPVFSQVYVDYERQQIGDQTYSDGGVLPSAFQGWGGGTRLIWKQTEYWIWGSQLAMKTRNYFTRSRPNGTERSDLESSVSMRVTRVLGPSLSAYLHVGYSKNSSTLGASDVKNENYQVQRAFAGFLWEMR